MKYEENLAAEDAFREGDDYAFTFEGRLRVQGDQGVERGEPGTDEYDNNNFQGSVENEDGENEGTVQLDRNFTLLLYIWSEGLRKMIVVDAVARLSPFAHDAWARFPVSTSCGLISLVLFSSQRGFSLVTPVFPSPQKPTLEFDLV